MEYVTEWFKKYFSIRGETISRHFEKMITLLGAHFTAVYVKPLDPTFSEVPTQLQDHPIYWPHFQVCVIFYIWISAIVYKIIQCMWNWKLLMFLLELHQCDWWHTCDSGCTYWEVHSILWKKGYPTQNVMAACDFDMLFTFVLLGWEDATHDTSIFLDTIRKQSNNFFYPPPSL